jgi:hypothetical protein
MVKDNDLYEIFVGDITFGIVEEKAGSIYDIVFADGSINEVGFSIHYTLGQGVEVLPKVEALLDQGKAVIVQIYMQRVPFFINYMSSDFALNEEHYQKNKNMYHTFLVVGYDLDHLYYVESPYVQNKANYIPDANNPTIGVIPKKDLIAGMNAFFNYTYLTFEKAQHSDDLSHAKLDIVKTTIKKSVHNYQMKPGESDGKIYFYGKEALNRLHQHFQNGTLDLNEQVTQFNVTLVHLLIWKLQFVMNRRYIMARALEKYIGCFADFDIPGLVGLLDRDVKTWRILASRLKKIEALNGTSVTGLVDLWGQIFELEERIVNTMDNMIKISI